MNEFTFIVETEDEGRIDKYLTEMMENITRSYIQKLIKENQVSVNGVVVKANHKVVAFDKVTILMPDLKEPDIEPEDIPLDILYEDEDILVVNKPKGMVVHPSAGHYSGTLVNALMYYCKGQLSGINGILRPGIVHRIDKDTTGSLLICKNDMAHQNIAEQLKEHTITRKYLAIVYGNIKEESGTVNAPIGRHPNDRKKMSINYKNGREAITHYRVIRRFEKYTYIECQLETGRTHQIRVHLASLHHPLLGDAVYGPPKSSFKLDGQTLHAKTLGIIHPRTKKYLEIDAPLPDYFVNLIKKL
ncbi:MAG: RluA family pseudouridine synthase [Lachnospiraceae bacterium]|nr:RluA family pseudouridine synthase [Lachnospiraceae bacterium]